MHGETRIGVVEFPGTNCMRETQAAVEAAGARAILVRWNEDPGRLRRLHGYVLAGGFAYEDRIRAGVIASKMQLLDGIAAAVDEGKPVLGICNGAQVLVESGLVPGVESGRVEVGLGPNAAPEWSGYYCGWVHLRRASSAGILASYGDHGHSDGRPDDDRDDNNVVPMPVGHGEGCFTGSLVFFEQLAQRGQIALRYVRPDGSPAGGFPFNPNASLQDAAGICDPTGRVLALMPHPERAAWLGQVPATLPGRWGERRRAAQLASTLAGPGPGLSLYACFVRAAQQVVQTG